MAAAEDDDDETFGEFSLASEEEEWGDFMKSPPHLLLSSDPWSKPTGALPLSLFGDVEDDANLSSNSDHYLNNMYGSTSDLNTAITTTSSFLDINNGDGGDGWEFNSEFQANNNLHFTSPHSSGPVICSNKSFHLFGTSNRGSIDDLFASSSVDSFATSLIGIQPSLNGFITKIYSDIEQPNMQGTSGPSPNVDVGGTDFDEDFGDFTVATQTVPKPVEASSVDVFSPSASKDVVSTTDHKFQEKDMKSNYHVGALPLSIFGYEEPDTGGCLDVQDTFMHQSTSDQRNSHTPTTVISDLISSLYSQAEQTSSVNTVEKPTTLSTAVLSSDLVNDADHLDDNSWGFQDATQTTLDTEASLFNSGDTYLSISSKLKLSNYLDFYSILKEELCLSAKCHIESIKYDVSGQQARDSAALSGEDATVASLDSEFQLMCQELEQMNFLFEESNLQDHPTGRSCLHELVEVLLEPQFQILESEYNLSQKLLQVEKDLRSVMELIRHTATMLKILTIGTLDERTTYISIWSEMVSVCGQELKHGASIWNQALEKHVQNQLLSEPQGRKFVLALGEIYRVVVVLGASAKLFKPWTLNSPAIYTLLEECHNVWSTSGLEEALSTALDNASLLESIKHILGLDALALQNYVFAEKGSLCGLSILTEKVAPGDLSQIYTYLLMICSRDLCSRINISKAGMKMIMWGEEQCFVTLANVWANLISCNPPKLPQLNLG
ncbi:hypothetical protein BUALT_Bualt01G0143000 [Buddleja alternifolia]|uniref:Synergin gamma C-terminal domain-containing protein n=1 Tax=Buddleja alternifolia TaxID=168488 RepID=A0AAV6YHW3_9LAMI|nr:hypothetical protein BUALT_Bualt01G0143000 [Buddleja alternifolia]